MANNPELLTRPLAEDGDKATIPDTTDGSTGIFSQQYGFQSINSLPLQAGGKAVRREDFNGAFNLLGGIAYYAQKGFTFNFDNTQNYFAGCVVIDATDGKRYECIADVAAGGSVPSADTTHWKPYGEVDVSGKANITLDNLAAYHRDVITTSGNYTTPATALYKITIKGGGGGGSASAPVSNSNLSGGGGGEGGTTIGYVKLTAGDSVSVTIGAGGAGGTTAAGSGGGGSSVTYDGNTLSAGGGGGGGNTNVAVGGTGGTGTIVGNPGGSGSRLNVTSGDSSPGGSGGGAGGGAIVWGGAGSAGTAGGGGAGGSGSYTSPKAGGAGGDGFISFEYFA